MPTSYNEFDRKYHRAANRIKELEAENERLRSSLKAIRSLSGKTLIGDGRYDEGANAAFEQAACIAASALQEDDDATPPAK